MWDMILMVGSVVKDSPLQVIVLSGMLCAGAAFVFEIIDRSLELFRLYWREKKDKKP